MIEKLTDAQWQKFEEEGYLKLGKILSEATLSGLQKEIDDIMLGKARVDYSRMLMQLDSDSGAYGDAGEQSKGFKEATLDYRKIQDLEYDETFLSLMKEGVFRDACARAYGKEANIACFRAMFMNKPAHKGTFLPWHQDRWTSLNRDPLLTVWVALDPATIENGCVQVIPGTHKEGLINPEHPSGFLTDEQAKKYCKNEDRIFLELEAGEVALLHNHTLHGSDVNKSDISRRAFSVCYMDAATRTKDGTEYPVIFGNNALELAKA
jgi:hypothetical protein